MIEIWKRNFLIFKKSLLMNAFWIFFEPVIYFLAFGYGLGQYISDIEGKSYSAFLLPALICNTAMLVAFYEASYGFFSKLSYQKTYQTILLSPISTKEIAYGEMLWAASKGFLSGLAVLLVGALFGLIDSWGFILVLPISFLTALGFAGVGMIVTTMVRNFDGIIYPSSGLIIPMALLSGTYFPISRLPLAFKALTQVLPLSWSVELSRKAMWGFDFHWWHLFYLVALVGFTYVVVRIGEAKFSAKVTK